MKIKVKYVSELEKEFENIDIFSRMHIWKVLKELNTITAYVEVLPDCKIFDTSYAALQLVRSKYPKDKSINTTQLLDAAGGEKMLNGIPIYQLK